MKRVPKDVKVPDLSRIYKLKFKLKKDQSIEDVLEEYQNSSEIEYAHLNYFVSICLEPNDPLYSIEWHLNNTGQMYPESGKYNTPPGTPDCDIDAPEAWDIETGSSDVIIAVIDSGVDYNHRDMQGNIWINEEEIPDNGVDDDSNGYIDDIYGYDWENEDNDPMDDYGHGTHCAGIIAARGDNGLDVSGVCWYVKIMPLKFINSYGSGSVFSANSAIYYAVNNGADILSNSWGASETIPSLGEAIDYAYSQGVIFIAAAGNSNTDIPHFPAYYDNAIAVAATDSNDQKVNFSNYGEWVDISAPGVDILSLLAAGTSKGTIYDPYTTILSGTSMACPNVAGVCGLLLSHFPNSSIEGTTTRLFSSVDDISTQNPDYNGLLGSGRINSYKCLKDNFTGIIISAQDKYSCNDIIYIRLIDFDIIDQQEQEVTLETEGGDIEAVLLSQDSHDISTFKGTVITSEVPIILGDGILQVSNEENVVIEYVDANDLNGNLAIIRNDSITIDCESPVIFDVQIKDVTGSTTKIEFKTNEPAIGCIKGGLSCNQNYSITNCENDFGIYHAIYLSGLENETTYYFIVDANDVAGNEATTDDNNGQCYTFTTNLLPATVYVPFEYPTIQSAIDAVSNNQTILVAPGTYSGQGNRDIDFKGKSITVKSEDGPYVTIIDCQGSFNYRHRGFYFHNFENSDSILEGFTIENGFMAGDIHEEQHYGGAIYCNSSSPTIKNNIIRNNSAKRGGGIACRNNSSPIIVNNIISFQYVFESGGGIYCSESSPLIINNTIVSNLGGNIYLIDSQSKIMNCIIWYDAYGSSDGINSITYSNTKDNYPGLGNISSPPLFADPNNGDFHLNSEASRYDPNTQTWVYDDVTSSCIDAGNPGCLLENEPVDPNNLRINMGAYGGTAEASKSSYNWSKLADLNNDGVVNLLDYAFKSIYWNSTGENLPGDLNRDNIVNMFDLVKLKEDYLKETVWHE